MSLRCCTAELHRPLAFRHWTVAVILALVLASPCWCLAQPAAPQAPGRPQNPEKAHDVALVRDLHTIPVPHDRPMFNVQMVNASLTPRDKEGIWVLDFAFKSLRIQTVDVPGKGRRRSTTFITRSLTAPARNAFSYPSSSWSTRPARGSTKTSFLSRSR